MKPYIRSIAIACFVLCSYCHSSKAQSTADYTVPIPLTLHQIWEAAATNNKAIRIKDLQLQHSAEKLKDARAERLPEIGIEAEYARISNMTIYEDGIFHAPEQFEVLHSTYKAGADAYFNLYNGGKLNLEIAARKHEDTMAIEQKQQTISDVKLRAAAYYLDMQRSRVFKNLLLKDIEAQQCQLQQIKNLKENGVVLKSDVLRAELKLSKQQLALVQLDNDIAIANQKLDILMGWPDEQRIEPIDTIIYDSITLKSYDDYLADADGQSHSLKISEQESALRKLQLKNVQANVRPKLGLFAEYGYNYPQIFLYPYSPYPYGLGLAGIKASFSISSFYHNNHKTKAARIAFESQETEHEQTRDVVHQQVKEAFLRYKEALNRIAVSKTNIEQATENRRIVSNTYFNQTSLITDLLDADTQLLQTRFDLAAAQIAAALQYFQLQNISGNL